MFKKDNINITDNNDNDTNVTVKVKKGNKMGKDTTFEALNENKIQKSNRNNALLDKAITRAKKGSFDEDLTSATNMDLLKVAERFTIREIFSIEKGATYFKLYKEVFYINNPHKYYFETVEPTVYRRITDQHEEGDENWAKAVAKEMNIEIINKA